MKRTILTFVGFVAALSLLWVGVVSAANVRSGNVPRVARDEVVNGTLYAAGRDLKVEGTVQGDVMCAGQNVEISGTVEGDVICAGQIVEVSGHVTGDVRIAGQTVTVSGKVDGSATLLGQTTDVTSAATVARDITITSQDATVEGAIGRDVEALVGNNFTQNGIIGRDLDVTSPSVTLNDKTSVAGTFMYTSTNNANVADGIKIGRTEHKIPSQKEQRQDISPLTYAKGIIFGMAGMLVIGLAMLLVAPRALLAASRSLHASPLGTVGTGLGVLFGMPFVALLCFITIIGIPLAVVIFFAWIVSLIIGMAITAHWLGAQVNQRLHWQQDGLHNVFALVIGIIVLSLLSLIPYVGGFVAFASVVWGEGALWYTIVKQRKITPAGGKK